MSADRTSESGRERDWQSSSSSSPPPPPTILPTLHQASSACRRFNSAPTVRSLSYSASRQYCSSPLLHLFLCFRSQPRCRCHRRCLRLGISSLTLLLATLCHRKRYETIREQAPASPQSLSLSLSLDAHSSAAVSLTSGHSSREAHCRASSFCRRRRRCCLLLLLLLHPTCK